MERDKKKECPIVPTQAIRLNINDDDYLLVSPTHDTIQVFPNMQYNYLRYFDSEDQQLKAFFLDNETLADLYDAGIPVTKRDSITEDEHELYQTAIGKIAAQFVEVEEVPEVKELGPADPIDVECSKVHQTFDAELEYIVKEWF